MKRWRAITCFTLYIKTQVPTDISKTPALLPGLTPINLSVRLALRLAAGETLPLGRRTCPGHATPAPFPLLQYGYHSNFQFCHSAATPTALRLTCLLSGLSPVFGLVGTLAAPPERGARPTTGLNRQDLFLPLGTCKCIISCILNIVNSLYIHN